MTHPLSSNNISKLNLRQIVIFSKPPKIIANYFVNYLFNVTFDNVYKYTPHNCDMEIETGFQGTQEGKYATSNWYITDVVGENTVLQSNILETGVLTLVVQNSSPTQLRLVGDEFWPTCVRTSKCFGGEPTIHNIIINVVETFKNRNNPQSPCLEATLEYVSSWEGEVI